MDEPKTEKWTNGPIDGLIIKELTKNQDHRGTLCETYRLDELPPGLQPVMSYISYTEPGISRGPHEHREQTDMFAIAGPGSFLLKVWDNRRQSPTYRNYLQMEAGSNNPVTVIIPPGVVHGYKNISKNKQGMVLNYPDRFYRGPGKKEAVDEVRHEDDPKSPFQMD